MSGSDVLLVDIGGDTGALVVYATDDLVGKEIEIVALDSQLDHGSPEGHDAASHRHDHPVHDHPVHNVVRRRRVGPNTYCAAVFPDLKAGTYRPFGTGAANPEPFTIVGGGITEIDWPEPR